ncbi:MAG TPA: tetratricopeptide repeat protein [archaeon]|nr:tetratricopeptide repeat protein [archaeon]
MEPVSADSKLPEELARRVRMVLEFHRWGGTAEGVTEGRTIYKGGYSSLRNDTSSIQSLCAEIAGHLKGCLPREVETLLTAGRMYRRSADYAKAREYFLKALELVYQGSKCA